jgi:hypothetical protein
MLQGVLAMPRPSHALAALDFQAETLSFGVASRYPHLTNKFAARNVPKGTVAVISSFGLRKT